MKKPVVPVPVPRFDPEQLSKTWAGKMVSQSLTDKKEDNPELVTKIISLDQIGQISNPPSHHTSLHNTDVSKAGSISSSIRSRDKH